MADEQLPVLFTAFNFAVQITVPAMSSKPLCSAAFQECDGLEITHEVKTIREGGNNARQIRLAGPMAYGQLTLRRGMTRELDLWRWIQTVRENPRARGEVVVSLFAPDRERVSATFRLSACLPLKLKAPAFNAKDGTVAIEEFQLAYEQLTLAEAAGGGGAP